jgi:uncharacterized repeat protein (TIGR01451 family)
MLVSRMEATQAKYATPSSEMEQDQEDQLSRVLHLQRRIIARESGSSAPSELSANRSSPMFPAKGNISASTVPISITESGLDPKVVTIMVGMTAMWKNHTQETVYLVRGEPYCIYLPLVMKNINRPGNHKASAPEPTSQQIGMRITGTGTLSGTLPPGESYTHTFTTVGSYPYFLANKPGWTGLIDVRPIPFDFALDIQPITQSVAQGQSISYTVQVTTTQGDSQPVTLTVGGLPAGAIGDLSPSTIIPTGTAVLPTGTAVLSITTALTTPVGDHTLVITGTGGGISHNGSVQLSVTPLPADIDDDHDGLSDYEEIVKYLTDPRIPDTDGDGIPDGDWEERREFAYSVRVEMRMRQPFDVETMNDLYQDVRVIEGPDDDGYTLIEAIIYPYTQIDVYSSPYPLDDLPPEMQAYTEPGIATNCSPSMQAEVLQIVDGAETDVEAVNQVLQWVEEETSFYLDYSIPEVYYTYLEDGEVKVRNYHGSLPVEELLETHYFADSMFELRTHGTCTSIATLKCAMLKAAGIPCQVIQTIHPIYYHGDQTQPYAYDLDREWGCVYEQPAGTGAWWCNHAFLEVYVGGRWVRVDRNMGVYHENARCLNLKIMSVSDWSEVDFSLTWPLDWIHQRPYYTLLLEDQEPRDRRLQVDKSAPTNVDPGSAMTYTLRVQNFTPLTLTNIVITDVIPANVTVVDVLDDGECESDQVSWSAPNLTRNESLNLRFVVTPTGTTGAVISNTRYSARAVEWPMRAVGSPVLTAIGRRNPIGTVRGYSNGTKITIWGRATMYTGGFYAGEDGEKFYVQDDSGGVQVYAWSTALPDVTIGDQVTATGELRTYHGESELVIFFPSHVSVTDDDPSQAPGAIDLPLDAVGESTEGRLVRIQGQVSWIEESTYGWFIELADEQADALVYVEKSTGIDVTGCQVGGAYVITGINTQYDDYYLVRPRLQADIVP